jgi:hypothetical protein
MIGVVPDACELGDLLKQGLFHPTFQGHIHSAATLATTAKLEYGELVLCHLYQRDLATVSSQ